MFAIFLFSAAMFVFFLSITKLWVELLPQLVSSPPSVCIYDQGKRNSKSKAVLLGKSFIMALTLKLYLLSSRIIFPVTSSLPNNLLDNFLVITILVGSFNAV